MKKFNTYLITLLFGFAVLLAGCSNRAVTYTGDGQEITITGDTQLERTYKLSTLSSITESYAIKEESEGRYVVDPSSDLKWTYTLSKSDPAYDGLVEEMEYYINTRGFDLEENDTQIIVSGMVDEDMQSEFGISFDENYREITLQDNILTINGDTYTEQE